MQTELLNINITKLVFTLISLGLIIFLRMSLVKITRRFAEKFQRFHTRTLLIIRYVNIFSFFLFLACLFLIWGINFKQIGVFMSSIFAVIGIALFAQWSILSNITSGIIMFFTFPYKTGDFIKIHEGDHPIYGYIEEIRAFHVVMRTIDNEQVSYPNSLMLQRGVSVLNEEHIQKLKDELGRMTAE